MMANDLVNRLRRARDDRSVLKLKLVTLRGKVGDGIIFVFEGDDDKIVYNRWISRIVPHLHYSAFVCRGKSAVSIVQDITLKDLGSLSENTFFFIDRDFDDKESFVDNDTLFMTDKYAIENYLVCGTVLSSILRDEFPLHEDPTLIKLIVAQFETDYRDFLICNNEFNRRLFIHRKLNIATMKSLPDNIQRYALVEVCAVSAPTSPIDDFIADLHAIPKRIDDALRHIFAQLDPKSRHRGKNSYMFFIKWLNNLCDHFDNETWVFSGTTPRGKIRRSEIGLGCFASKSSYPLGLPEFLTSLAT